jgi:hypothetical protein
MWWSAGNSKNQLEQAKAQRMASVKIPGIQKCFGVTTNFALALGRVSQNASFMTSSTNTFTNIGNSAVRQMTRATGPAE